MTGVKNENKVKNKQLIIVLGVVLNHGKVLMSQRFEEECPEAHLKWELPGGKIDFGESPEIALAREILEETGVEVCVEQLLPTIRTCMWNYTDGTRQHTILIGYKCKFIKQAKPEKPDHHVEKSEWVKVAETEKLETLPGDLDFIKEALAV